MVFPWFSHGFPIKHGGSFHGVFCMFTRSGIMIPWIHHPMSILAGSYPLGNVDITGKYHFFMGKPWENHGKMVIYMEQ